MSFVDALLAERRFDARRAALLRGDGAKRSPLMLAARHAELGLRHEVERATADGLQSVDIAVWRERDERVALEVDGPTHFARNTRRALGHTVLRDRLLRRRPLLPRRRRRR